MFNAIQLTDEEKALARDVQWNMAVLVTEDFVARTAALEQMGRLTESLLRRKAIPTVRLDFFAKPKMNVGGHGKSRAEVFERNGTHGKEAFRHPHFAQYLRYFIFGPDLPEVTIAGFQKIVDDGLGTSGMVLEQLAAFVRSEIRQKRLDRRQAAEEFFKLAHEIGRPDLAENVRSAAMSVRSAAR